MTVTTTDLIGVVSTTNYIFNNIGGGEVAFFVRLGAVTLLAIAVLSYVFKHLHK